MVYNIIVARKRVRKVGINMKVSDLILINGGWDYDEMLEVYKRVTIETLPKYDVLHKYGDNEILAFRDKMIIIK